MKKYNKEDIVALGFNDASRKHMSITASRFGAVLLWVIALVCLLCKAYFATILFGLAGYGFWKIGSKLNSKYFN